ncbi:DUF4065 domain-containing protein [Apilactobacillus sp. TMW 2.2459]|uniref:Panacea domain-containing protein n=1 Tax=Apilactobacillus xinyiensis TaxID=2841032 RepID=UPI00200DB2AD|nr:type II toxin-antitoxin system antitoxin SocA domain-containing protein [Apilactobacillus xinyiensis]MCL0312310.1 DUF4065 domain-containing protein [Apilactobacillus xinyiensis]
MANAIDVADYVVYRANKENSPVSNLMLQKVLYFLNTIHLLKNGKPLINDFKFEKWGYGPVLIEVYSEYASNGAYVIKKPSLNIFIHRGKNGVSIEQKDFSKEDLNFVSRDFIDNNIHYFINKDPFYLVKKSREEDQWQRLSTNDKYDDSGTIKFYKNHKSWND